MGTDWGYSRSSSDEQDGQGMKYRLLQAGIPEDRIYEDIGVSGMKEHRPGLDALLAVLQPGDTVTVPELSRIGRNVRNVLALIDSFEEQGIGFRALDIGLDSASPVGRAVMTILSAINRLERDFISQRTKAALDARRAAGMKLGGSSHKLGPAQEQMAIRLHAKGESFDDIGTALGVSHMTIRRIVARAG